MVISKLLDGNGRNLEPHAFSKRSKFSIQTSQLQIGCLDSQLALGNFLAIFFPKKAIISSLIFSLLSAKCL